jgi:hypothetical protein
VFSAAAAAAELERLQAFASSLDSYVDALAYKPNGKRRQQQQQEREQEENERFALMELRKVSSRLQQAMASRKQRIAQQRQEQQQQQQQQHEEGQQQGQQQQQQAKVVAAPVVPVATMAGQSNLGYFGKAQAVGDFDGDGWQDIAISAYGASWAGQPQRGYVEVAYGGSNSSSHTASPSSANASHAGHAGSAGNGTTTTLYGPSLQFGRFGWAMAALDFNLDGIQDLAVSSPVAGW